jgi:phosphate transport system permease protein
MNTTNTLEDRNLVLESSKSKAQDKLFQNVLKVIVVSIITILVTLVILLIKVSYPAISEFGFQFFTSSDWNPVEDVFGALPFIWGTVYTSLVALLIATPVSVGVALFISEICPKSLKSFLSLFVELIASIPSIVFGLWGLFYLAPWVKDHAAPFLESTLGFTPFFQGPSFGIGFFTSAIILAIMITPTITSLCREVFYTVPRHQFEAALALGATRSEAIKLAIIGPSFSGIVGAVVLGLGRALGETMAVAMLIGNSPELKLSLFSPGATMASVIANEYAEATSDLHVAALCYIALCLFIVTLIINFTARRIVKKFSRV